MVSTRGRYALRVLLALAEYPPENYVPLTELAAREDISEKYLESIVALLARGGLLKTTRGRAGGYRLALAPEDCTVGSVLALTETSLAPVTCLQAGSEPCDRAETCRTRPVWTQLEQLIEDYLQSVTLADLLSGGKRKRRRLGKNHKKQDKEQSFL